MRRIETERLAMRPLESGDLAAMHRVFNDLAVRRYLWDDKPVSLEMARSCLERSARDFSERGVGLFGVRLRGEAELIGLCGLRWEEGIGGMEIMYCLLPEWWGRGLATEAARACLRYAFDGAGLGRVFGGADAPNVASLQIIKKLGMGYVGNILAAAPNAPYFALTREEFDRRKWGVSLTAGPAVIGHPASWISACEPAV